MKKFLQILYFAFILFLFIVLIVFPDRYLPSAFKGISLWAVTVLPALLPFFFLTALLTSTGTVFKLSKSLDRSAKILYGTNGLAIYCQIMSLLSGYPIGAKLVLELYENNLISKTEAKHIAATASTSGPLFIVGSVAIGMFNDKKLGFILLIVHIFSSVFCGICFRKRTNNKHIGGLLPKKACDNVLYESIYSSVISVLIVGGFIAIFYCLSEILCDFKLLAPFELVLSPLLGKDAAIAFSQGLIECTSGIKNLSSLPNFKLSAVLSSALIAFGGLSVWCQSMIYLKKIGLKIKTFAAYKIVQMAFSMLFCYFLVLIFY